VANIQSAVEYIYPLVYPFQKPKTQSDLRLGTNTKELFALAKAESTVTGEKLSNNGTNKGIKRKHDDLATVSDENKSDTSADND
jgi:hypothetical protein